MRTILPAALVATIVVLAGGAPSLRAGPGQAGVAPPAFIDLLDAYWNDNLEVVTQRFATGAAVAPMVPAVRAWTVSAASRMWRQAGLVLTIDLAVAALTRPSPAPGVAAQLVALGQDDLLRREPRDEDHAALPREFERIWLETAAAIHLDAGALEPAATMFDRLDRRNDASVSPRLWLLRGILTELQGGRDGNRVLENAVRAYDRAAREPLVRAEASARAALVMIRLNRHRDAIRRLDIAGDATEDVLVASWLAYLRGVALAGLGEGALALAAHEQALALMPDAAPARAGRALALRMLGRDGAPAVSPTTGIDPWAALEHGDRRAIATGLAALKASLAATASPTRAAARPAVFETFDRYDAGEYDAVVQELLQMDSLEQLSSDVRTHADRWVTDASPNVTARRLRVLALVALEAARARGIADWPRAHLLVEWACERLRAAPAPDDFERRWLRAAAAVMAGAVQSATMEVHVAHALTRLPADPPLVMARAVAAELRAGPDRRTPFGLRPPFSGLDVVTSRLKEAAALDEYREEGNLRLGYTALRRGKEADALPVLAIAAQSADVAIRYLAHLFTGRALEKLDRVDEAVRAYAAAVETIPGAQSAEIALAAAVSRQGDQARAAALAERALTGTATVQDPWLYYGQGDFRHWPAMITWLREEAR